MDLRKIKKLIELAEESDIAELEVANGEESVRIVMHRDAAAPQVVTQPAAIVAESAPFAAAVASHGASSGTAVPSPMAGTFYRAPHPDADPFTQVGNTVQSGDVLCIIESMKMMHEIRAGQDGTVAEICIANGAPIGTGEVLFRLS